MHFQYCHYCGWNYIGANTEGRPPEVSFANCVDRHHNCAVFERQGECHKNPGWMIVNCAKSCNACHLRDAKVRCQRFFILLWPQNVNDLKSIVVVHTVFKQIFS